MKFQENSIFHVYNQGNNRDDIFFTKENYRFFKQKMKQHISPYADFLCYCLMPNHFHWLIYVRHTTLPIYDEFKQQTINRTLNDSIGILLRAYTRAINNQENRSGSLFRKETKAKDGWEDPSVLPGTPDFRKVYKNWDFYGINCFNYIHENPAKAGLVNNPLEWEHSSIHEFQGRHKHQLCNVELARELLRLPM